MTGKELAAILKMSEREFNHNMNPGLRRTKVAEISVSEWTEDSEWSRDRTYTLISQPKRIAPQQRSIVISKKSIPNVGEDQRQKNILAAKRRARLIAAGLYIGDLR